MLSNMVSRLKTILDLSVEAVFLMCLIVEAKYGVFYNELSEAQPKFLATGKAGLLSHSEFYGYTVLCYLTVPFPSVNRVADNGME